MRRSIAAFVCAVALAGAVGCGDDNEGARDAAEDYVDATNEGDAAMVCELYSDQLKRALAIEESCEGFVEEQTSGRPAGGFEVVEVTEDGDRATAQLETTGETGAPVPLTITLVREDGDWRIATLGPSGAD
jgi:ketosteroid isomerase-like protein